MKNNSYVSDEIALLLKDNSINIKSEREIAWDRGSHIYYYYIPTFEQLDSYLKNNHNITIKSSEYSDKKLKEVILNLNNK